MRLPAIALAVTLLPGLLAATAPSRAQPAKIHRVGFLSPISSFYPWAYASYLWLGERGYVNGVNIVFEHSHAEGTRDRLFEAAAELVGRSVEVIVTSGTPAIRAAGRATRTVPIVALADDDPVRTTLVASLARPGGNLTGVVAHVPQLGGQRLEMLQALVPRLRRVIVLWNPADPEADEDRRQAHAAARALGLELDWVDVRGMDELASAMGAAAGDETRALLVLIDNPTRRQANLVVEIAAQSGIPAMYASRYFVDLRGSGGLISYGPSPFDLARRLAVYVDKILKGAEPGELPMERPSRYELVVNVATARTLGLPIPLSLLIQADEVIP